MEKGVKIEARELGDREYAKDGEQRSEREIGNEQ